MGKWEMCAKFQQKILNSIVVEAPQSFLFFIEKTWFLENKRALSKFLYGVLHCLTKIIKS